MTTTDQCSLTFSATQAREAFVGSSTDKVVLALLAGVPPEPVWNGACVFQAPGPGDQVRLGFRGPAANVIRDHLAARMEQVGIHVLDRGEEPDLEHETPIARVDGGAWV